MGLTRSAPRTRSDEIAGWHLERRRSSLSLPYRNQAGHKALMFATCPSQRAGRCPIQQPRAVHIIEDGRGQWCSMGMHHRLRRYYVRLGGPLQAAPPNQLIGFAFRRVACLLTCAARAQLQQASHNRQAARFVCFLFYRKHGRSLRHRAWPGPLLLNIVPLLTEKAL